MSRDITHARYVKTAFGLCELMIFAALLKSGTGSVHVVNERLGAAYRRSRSREWRHTPMFAVGCLSSNAARLHANRRIFITSLGDPTVRTSSARQLLRDEEFSTASSSCEIAP